jgi:iron complex transport system substrate-binding protein
LTDRLGANLDGVLAEYAVFNEEAVVPLPTHLSFEEAVTLPCAAVTAWVALAGHRRVTAGDTVRTQGSGGVAVFALQFAQVLGARVIATTSTAEKAERRREKPRVSAFTSANIDKILALKPDLVLTFSDLQARIVTDLIRRGLDVHAFNQRSIAGIFDMIRMLGAMVDASERARQLVGTLEMRLADVRTRAERLSKQPRVFFEEWDDPLISGIGWVSELIEIAGGVDIFADRRNQGAAKDRVVTAEEVGRTGARFDHRLMVWQEVQAGARCNAGLLRPHSARAHQDLYEIKSSLILQPGPAALTDGLAELQKIIGPWATVAG